MIKEENNTGYPHIDKPWMKWYDNKDTKIVVPQMNLNKYLKEKVKNLDPNNIAQTYYGKEITYKSFFNNVDDASKVFDQMRIKVEDRIMYFVAALPETPWLWLGGAQMGITSDFVDPRPDGLDMDANSKKVLEIVKKEKANYIVALDIFYVKLLKPIENELKDYGINEIILLSPSDSMTLLGKLDYLTDTKNYQELENERGLTNYIISLLTNEKDNFSKEIEELIYTLTYNCLSYNKQIELVNNIKDKSINKEEVIKKIKNYKISQLKASKAVLNKLKMMKEMNGELDNAIKTSPIKVYKYKDLVNECKNAKFNENDDIDLMTYIAHTSGTSSEPKAIPATTRQLITVLEDLYSANHQFLPKQRMLQFFAPYAPIGGVNSFLLNIASGSNSIIIPEIVFDDFWYIVDKLQGNGLLLPPTLLTNLLKDKHMKNKDLSYIERIIYGGGGIKEKDEELCNEILKKNGSKARIEVGHGQSEYLGCGAYAKDDYKKYESIGIPLPNTIYTIVDPSSEEMIPVKFNDDDEFIYGELAVSSGAVSFGILDGRVITKHYMMDGVDYIKTNDLVRMDRDGVFYHESRKDNVFTRYDGYKICPYGIEKAIEGNEHVISCNIVAYNDIEKGGNMPIAHLVLNKELNDEETYELITDLVYNQIIKNKDLNSRITPSLFKIRESLPVTKNGKVDFRALANEQLDGSEIKVSIKETSSSVGDVTIELPEKSNKNIRIKK